MGDLGPSGCSSSILVLGSSTNTTVTPCSGTGCGADTCAAQGRHISCIMLLLVSYIVGVQVVAACASVAHLGTWHSAWAKRCCRLWRTCALFSDSLRLADCTMCTLLVMRAAACVHTTRVPPRQRMLQLAPQSTNCVAA